MVEQRFHRRGRSGRCHGEAANVQLLGKNTSARLRHDLCTRDVGRVKAATLMPAPRGRRVGELISVHVIRVRTLRLERVLPVNGRTGSVR